MGAIPNIDTDTIASGAQCTKEEYDDFTCSEGSGNFRICSIIDLLSHALVGRRTRIGVQSAPPVAR
jgi:hypothetical protein